MAAAPHAGAAPDGCLRDHSARHAPGTRTRPRISQPQTNPSPHSMIFRRLPASSSFVLAAARLRALQRDPGPRGEKTRAAARKDPEEQSAQPDGARSHRARSVCPLDTGGPYGCRIAGVMSSYTYAPGCMSRTVAAIIYSTMLFVSGACRTSDTQVIIPLYIFEKLSDDHPCILRYTAEG